MNRWLATAAIFLVFAAGLQADEPDGPPVIYDFQPRLALSSRYAEHTILFRPAPGMPPWWLRPYAHILEPEPEAHPPREQVRHHPWEKIHLVHITRLCYLRVRFLRAIYAQENWITRIRVFPLGTLWGGRFHYGIEASRILWVETDHRIAVLARQGVSDPLVPPDSTDVRLGVTLRWKLP